MKSHATASNRSLSLLFVSIAVLSMASLQPLFAAQNGPWADVPQTQARSMTITERLIEPQRYRTVGLDRVGLDGILRSAPVESLQAKPGNAAVLSLPLADGSFGRFRVEESPIMDAAMAARLPDVKTYRGVGIDDPSAFVRFDTTPAGFHAMILSDKGTVFIDPYARGETSLYVVYDKRDFNVPAAERPICLVGDPSFATTHSGLPLLDFGTLPERPAKVVDNGATFKTVRLAVAATGEYTAFHGGTVPLAQAAIVTTMNRVNAVYEHDLAIRMNLVDNTAIVFTDAGADPYTNVCSSTELNINQTTIDNAIGATNYDLGHVMGGPGGGGGIAGVGPCLVGAGGNFHARGCTGRNTPIGDPFDIDYVAHEIGHQWGAPHTFNGSAGSCGGGNRSASSAYEPGSGSTIMAYAGICGSDNLQPNSDPYFHGSSLEKIAGYDPTVFGFAQCIVSVASGNTPPTAAAGLDRNIPKGTPFELCGTGTDAGNNVSFLWEEYDLGPAGPPNNASSAPFFRSFSPTPGNCRTFPKLNDILTDTATIGEILPNVAVPMKFRLTVFDNDPGAFGGGFDQDEVNVTVDGNSGPFRVTAPNAATGWNGGENQVVTWDVANTNVAPVSCANVDILFSTDGGQTFPTTLATATPNDGTHPITVPAGDPAQARVKVQCSDNVFFDISDAQGGGGGCTDDVFETEGSGANDDICWGSYMGVPPATQTHLHCDEDWVYFAPQAGKTYVIETSNLVGGADTVISLHDLCGPALATNDDGGTGLASRIEWTATSSNALDVRIIESGGAYGAGKGYDITVTELGGCPATLNLANQTVTTAEAFVAQNQITTGPAFVVTNTGDATLTAGTEVIFGNDTSILGLLTVNLTPNPCNGAR